MNALAIVVYLVGQAWAVNANGERRALKAGDQLGPDETLVLAEGARIDLDFGDDQQLTFLGNQQVTAQQREKLAVDENEPASLDREEDPVANNTPPYQGSEGSSEGHGFIQLVRIGEIIEANGYTPVTVARIKEVLRPFGLSLPQLDFVNDDPRYSDPSLERDEGNNGAPDSGSKLVDVSISIDVIAGNDIVDATEAAQDITISGAVGDGVSPGDAVTVMVNGNAYETTVNADGRTWQVDVPGSELAQDNSIFATVDSVQPNGTPVSGSTERPYLADAIAPTVEVELEPGSGPNGDYNDIDTNDGNVSGTVTFDPGTTEPGDIVKITDKDGNVLIERPITDDDIANGITLNVPVNAGQTNVELNAEVTDPVGNTGSGSDANPVDNLTPGVDVELEPGSGSNGKYNAADTSDGEVEGTITFDPGTTFPGDKLTVTDKDGNPINDGNGVPITDYELTQDDIDNGLVVGVPVADGQTEVEINVDVTDSAGNTSSDSASNPVDNVVVVAELSVDETNVFEGAPDLEYTVTLKDSDGNIVIANNDITVTTTLGSVTITAGNSSGSFSLPVQGDDVYVDGETITNQILNAVEDSLGGSGVFENLTIDGAPIATVVSDTDDTSTVSLDNPTVAEGSDITLTATVDNAPRTSDLVLTLSNGETITIAVGQTTGSVTFANPNGEDVYVDGGTESYSITGAAGGDYEDLDTSATSTVTVTDTVDSSTVTLGDVTVNEGDDITLSATVDNAPQGSDLVLTLNNGETITIVAGATTGSVTFANPNGEDGYVDGESLVYSISSSDGGGSYEALDTSDTATVTVNDTVDTSTVTLANSVANEGADITINASVDTAPQGSALVLTLNNGEQITIAAGATTGSVTFANPNGEDVYVDGESLVYSVAASSGGNYESLDTSSTSTVVVSDTDDTSTVSLDNPTVAEGSDITLTATVDNAPRTSDLVLTLSNGETITIAVGQTTGSVTFANPNGEDVYVDGGTESYSITGAAGGDYEDLDTSATSTVTVTDTVDSVYAIIEVDSAAVLEGGSLSYTVSLVDENGDPAPAVVGKDVTVNLNWTGAAANGSDINALPANVTITGGDATTSFVVTSNADTVSELSEALTVTIDSLVDNGGVNPGFENLQVEASGNSATSQVLDAPTIEVLDDNGTADGQVTVYEQGLDSGDGSNTVSAVLRITAPSGLESIEIGGEPFTLAEIEAFDGTQTVTVPGHGEITLNGATMVETSNGQPAVWEVAFDYELTDEQIHSAQGADDALKDIPLAVTAADPQNPVNTVTGSGTLGVLVTDDTSEVDLTGAKLDEAEVDETQLGSPGGAEATVDFSGAFDIGYGADGDNGVVYELVIDSANSGLVETASGDPVSLFDNNGVVEGRNSNGDVAFTITVDELTGEVTLVQLLALQHQDPLTPNDEVKITNGVISLQATATDGDGDEESANVNVGDRFIFQDDGPSAVADSGAVSEGATLTVAAANGVLINDSAGADGWADNGNAVVGVIVGGGGSIENANVGQALAGLYGTLTLNADGSYDYVATADGVSADAQDVFTYTVKDGDGDLSATTLAINVADVTGTPTDTTGAVDEAGITGGSDEAADSETTSGNLSLQPGWSVGAAQSGSSAHGSWQVNTDGTYSYTLTQATPGDNASDSFSYTAVDADGNTVINTVTISITDDSPEAVADSGNVSEGDTLTVAAANGVLVNDTAGADDWSVSGAIVGIEAGDTGSTSSGGVGGRIDGQYGYLVLNADGSYEYVATANAITANAQDVFTYTARDGDGDETANTLTINVADVTGAPSDTLTSVDEAGIIGGSDEAADSETASGNLNLQAGWLVEAAQSGTGAHGDWQVNTDGTYSYTLTEATSGDNTSDSFSYTAVDADGNTVINTVTIDIVDDEPVAVADAGDTVTEGAILNVDASDGVLTNDIAGADGWTNSGSAVIGVRASGGDTSSEVTTDTGNVIAGEYGSLTLLADGSYTYVANADEISADEQDVFVYTVEDADGDRSTTTLTINVEDVTGSPVSTTGTVDEAGLVGGSDEASDRESTAGSLNLQTGWSLDPGSAGNQVGNHGTLTINGDGSYSYTLTTPVDDIDGADETDTFTYTAVDQYGNTVENTVVISIVDDEPTVSLTGTPVGSLAVDESDMAGGTVSSSNAQFVDGVFGPDYGADGAADTEALVYSLAVTDGTASGVTDVATGTDIYLFMDGDDVVGRVGDINGAEALRIEIAPDTGAATLTQSRPLQHTDTASHNDALSLTGNAIQLVATATDGDGDEESANVNVGDRFTFLDDGPVIGAAPAIAVLNEEHLPTGSNPDANASTVSTNLDVDLGADGGGGGNALIFTADQAALAGVLTASGNGDIVVAVNDNILTATRAGDPVFTVTLQVDGNGQGSYTFELQGSMQHLVLDTHALNFRYQAIDGDGDTATGSFTVNIDDDQPSAVDDTDTVPEGSYAPIAGNVITDATGQDETGADGATISGVTAGSVNTEISGSVGSIINGNYGSLQLNADGSYTYSRNPGTPGDAQDIFSYTLKDSDGDWSTATLTVGISDADVSISDLTPEASGGDVLVNESKLVDGTGVGAGDVTANGTFTINSPDGIESLTISHNGTSENLVLDNVTQALPTITTALGNTLEITGYDANTGVVSYTYTLNDDENHPDAGRDDVFESFVVSLEDKDGDTASDTLAVRIIDDIPVITQDTGDAVSLEVDETTLANNDSADFSGLFSNVDYGADGAAATDALTYTLEVDGSIASGLVDTASDEAVVLTINGDGTLITGTADGQTVLTISINDATGEITLDQQRAVKHADTNNPDDAVTIVENAINIVAAATDGDADTVTSSIAIGDRFSFKDDGPSITAGVTGTLPNALTTDDADTASGTSTDTANFSGAFSVASSNAGEDGDGGTVWNYALAVTDPATGLSSNGEPITVALSGNTITAQADGNTVFTIAVDAATGVVTLTQNAAIDHDTAEANSADFSSDTKALLAGLITLTGTATITDADGDSASSSQTIDIGDKFVFTDDGPSVGVPEDASVSEANLAGGSSVNNGALTQTGSLDIGLSADGVDTTFVSTTEADFQGLGLTSNNEALSYELSADGHTLTATADGNTIFVATITNPEAANAGYSFVLSGVLDHDQPGNDAQIDLPFNFVVTDNDGDTATGSFDVTVNDDVPTAVDQAGISLSEGGVTVGSASGGTNLITGGVADSQGADGARINQVRYADINGDQQIITVAEGGNTGAVTTQYGSLTVHSDGTWSYTSNTSVEHSNGVAVDDLFSYNLIDGDDDVSGWADQPLSVTDTTPVAVDDSSVTAPEGTALLSGNLIGNDIPSEDGSPTIYDFSYTDVTGNTQTFEFLPLVLTQAVTTPTGILTVNADGGWNFVPNASYEHDGTGSSNAGSFGYRLVDNDGSISNQANQPIIITDTDPTADNTVTLAIDEENINGLGSANAIVDNEVTVNLGITKGQDDIADVVFDEATKANLASQGLSSGGIDLLVDDFDISPDGHTLTAAIGGNTIFTLQLNNPGDAAGALQSITMTLEQPLDHGIANGENNLPVNVNYVVSDIDSDVDGSLTINVTDDIPSIPVDDSAVSVVEGAAAVGSANGGDNLLGNDTLGADGGFIYDISYTDSNGNAQTNVAVGNGGLTVSTQFGELTVQQDGSWTYTPIDSADHIKPANDTELRDDFSYRVIDNDGDISAASATQQITVTDTVPEVGTPVNSSVDEENLPTGADPDPGSLTATGSLDVTKAEDSIDTEFTVATTDALTALGLTSNGESLSYSISLDGHTLTATEDGTNATVFSVTINNPTTSSAGYSFTLDRALDHPTAADIDLPFSFTVTDSDGDVATSSFNVAVVDDVPALTQAVETDEDTSVTFNSSADANPGNTSIPAAGLGAPSYGTATVNADGTITYTPTPGSNYSGEDSFTYTTTENGGVVSTTTVTVTVNPISDAPTFTATAGSVETDEDTAVSLGFNAPVVTDASDLNGLDAGDNPELLSVITLSGIPDGATLLQADGTTVWHEFDSADGGSITITLNDGSHINGASGDLSMSSAEFAGLKILPPPDSHENFTVTGAVTSYEVDNSGNPIPDAGSETTTAPVLVYVQAVTDDAALTFDNTKVPADVANVDALSFNGGQTEADVTIKEDTAFVVNDILEAAFADLDGSEERSITISNNSGAVILVNGTEVAAGADITVQDKNGTNGQTGEIGSFPNITIGATEDFSGDLENIGITINAQDKDSDGFNAGNSGSTVNGVAEADTTDNTVTLNLHVMPVAGDVGLVAGSNVTTPEDTAVAFMDGIEITDPGTGTEVITKVTFEIPAGWDVTAPAASADWNVSTDGTDYTITAVGAYNLEDVLGDFTITPPPHSSVDQDITVTVTTEDSNTVDGAAVTSDPVETELTIPVEVTAVAEELAGDSDVDGNDDLTMSGDHDYTVTATEDVWFDMSQEAALDGWNNQDQDGSEQTLALFTPTLTDASGDPVSALGSQFQYNDGTGLITKTFNGDAVEIPEEFLDTLKFRGPDHFSGYFEVNVSIKTIDTDPDTNDQSTWSGGNSVLTGTINPVADDVRLSVTGRARGDEDTDIPLSIRPVSSDTDSSETFTVTLSGIPADAVLTYDGVELVLTDDGLGNGTVGVEIEDFDRTVPMTIRPPENSNEDFTIGVSAVSVDELGAVTSTSGPDVESIDVIVKGVADEATLTTDDPSFTEAAADAAGSNFEGFGSVSLNQVITASALTDDDGSEKLTLSISGLDAQFNLSGGAFIGGVGEGRTWLLTEDQLATAKVLLPINFSGTVTANVVAITTENDGNSLSSPSVDLEFTVAPSIDEAIKTGTNNLQEDTLGKVDFSLAVPGEDDDRIVDGNETLTSIWIDQNAADTSDYTLYLGAGGKTLAQAVADGEPGIVLDGTEYKITGAAIDNIFVQGAANLHGDFSFDVGYEITDPSSDGSLPVVSERTDTTHTLSIEAVTDAATLVIDSITSDPAGAATITGTTAVHATENTELTINATLSKDPDANAGNSSDYDGSEVITEIYVDGVPAGVTVENAVYIGNIPGDPNTGRWLLSGGPTGTSLSGGATSFEMKVSLTGTAANLSDLSESLSFNVVTEDADGGEQVSSDDFLLTTPANFDDTNSEVDQPAVIDIWEDDPAFNATEDVSFSLSDALNAQITGSSDFAITITGFPAGTSVSGMTLTVADGVDTWTVSGSGGDAALQAALDAIQVNLPEDWNDNNAPPFDFETTLTTYAASGDRNDSTANVAEPVTPVTDPSVITISNDEVVGEDSPVNFTVDIDNSSDGSFSSVVNGNLYLQLSETGMSGGTLSYQGTALTAQAVSGVAGIPDGNYYIADIGNVVGNGDGSSIALTYQPPENQTGSVELQAWVQTKETGAANVESSSSGAADDGEGAATILPVNDGFDLAANDVSGDEDTLIELDVSGTGLVDTDGSESINSVLLSGLPTGYLVYTGADEGSAVLANNAGVNGWSIPIVGGQLPAFIGVRPPLNVSGVTLALTLTALTGESALLEVESSSIDFDVTVNPVADGLSIAPENAAGTEGDVITIDVNPSLIDQDELVNLELSGLGEYASFYAEGSLLTAEVSYDDLSDTYTISGLSEDQLGDLGFVQKAGTYTVNVSAETVDGMDVSTATTDSFTATVAAVVPSAGNDVLLYGGLGIDADAGDDTIQLRFSEDVSASDLASNLDNVEVLDAGIAGSNSIGDASQGLSIQDVLDMTDARGTLTIEGDSSDDVYISDNWTDSGTSGAYTVYTSAVDGATLNVSDQMNVHLVTD